jgi:hypothetical protein
LNELKLTVKPLSFHKKRRGQPYIGYKAKNPAEAGFLFE